MCIIATGKVLKEGNIKDTPSHVSHLIGCRSHDMYQTENDEDCSLSGCEAVQPGRNLQTFQRTVLPSPSRLLI
jgi:hypothetical protein